MVPITTIIPTMGTITLVMCKINQIGCPDKTDNGTLAKKNGSILANNTNLVSFEGAQFVGSSSNQQNNQECYYYDEGDCQD